MIPRIKCRKCRQWAGRRITAHTFKLRAEPPHAGHCVDCAPRPAIAFGPVAVAQALAPIFGDHRALDAARETPLHTDPAWTTIEDQIEKATRRARAALHAEIEVAEVTERNLEIRLSEASERFNELRKIANRADGDND